MSDEVTLVPAQQFPDRADAPSMTEAELAELKTLQGKQAEVQRVASTPTLATATHYVHLADGRVVLANSAAGTIYSEGAGTASDPEKFTRIVGIYER